MRCVGDPNGQLHPGRFGQQTGSGHAGNLSVEEHIKEHSLRTLGDPDALADREEALEERFLQLSGETSRTAVQAYTTLTLVRHIYLSTLFPQRRHLTETLMELCERRLAPPTRLSGPAFELSHEATVN